MLDDLVKLANPQPVVFNESTIKKNKLEVNYQIVAYRTTPDFKVTIPFYMRVTELDNEWDTETVGNGSRKFTPAWSLINHLKKINQIVVVRIMTSFNLEELKATCNAYVTTYKGYGGCWLNDNYYKTTAISQPVLIPEITDKEKIVFDGLSKDAKIILADKLYQQQRSQKSNRKTMLKNALTLYQESRETLQDFTTFGNTSHKNHSDLID